jgi:methoxymalonate biosynthesis acyl carrier protein
MVESIRERTRAFLTKHVRQDGLTDSADLFAGGFVTSLFALQLVLFIEAQFSVTVENDDLDLANFRSVDAISAFVARKQGAAAESAAAV